MKVDIVLAAVAFLLGSVIAGFGVHAWHVQHPTVTTRTLIQKIPVGAPTTAPVAPQLSGAPIAPAKVSTCAVEAYTAPQTVREHLLPKPIADSPKQAIVASSRIEPDDHPETVTATIDTDTGKAVQSVVREPLPWLAVETKREASVDLLEKTSGPVVRLQARQDLFQVKALHFHVMAGGDVPVPIMGMMGKPGAYVGVGLHFAW
jgi:hypothetical protein